MITSPLKKEIQNECHTHLLCLRAVHLDIFVTHIKAQLSVMSIAMSIYVMALVSYFWGGKTKRLSSLGNQLKGIVVSQIVNQVSALMRITSIQNCCKLQQDMSSLSPLQQQAWC